VKIAWLLVLAVAVAGYAGIVAPAERTVRSLTRESQDLYELTSRNEALLAQRSSLARLRDRVQRDLDELGAVKTPAKAALALLELLDREGKLRDVSVGTFAPDETAAGAEAQQISLSIHGSYENLLPFLSDLTRQRPLVEVESAELQRQADGSNGSDIDAQVRVALYRTAAGFIHAIQTEVHSHDTTDHD
jgi:Tfp pilus assembly protein PilO